MKPRSDRQGWCRNRQCARMGVRGDHLGVDGGDKFRRRQRVSVGKSRYGVGWWNQGLCHGRDGMMKDVAFEGKFL